MKGEGKVDQKVMLGKIILTNIGINISKVETQVELE